MFTVIITGDDNHLGVRGGLQDIFQYCETLTGSVCVWRQTEVKGNNRWLVLRKCGERLFPVSGDFYFIVFKAPAKLRLQPRVIFNHE